MKRKIIHSFINPLILICALVLVLISCTQKEVKDVPVEAINEGATTQNPSGGDDGNNIIIVTEAGDEDGDGYKEVGDNCPNNKNPALAMCVKTILIVMESY